MMRCSLRVAWQPSYLQHLHLATITIYNIYINYERRIIIIINKSTD